MLAAARLRVIRRRLLQALPVLVLVAVRPSAALVMAPLTSMTW